jgi:hypothetical protein
MHSSVPFYCYFYCYCYQRAANNINDMFQKVNIYAYSYFTGKT